MGVNESTLRSAGILLVLDRREEISDVQMKYLKTKEFKSFFNQHIDQIKEEACRIYGLELQEAVNNNNKTDVNSIVDEINDYCQYLVPSIAFALDDMAISGNDQYIQYIGTLVDFVDFVTLSNAVIGGNKDLYDEIKQYDEGTIKETYFHTGESSGGSEGIRPATYYNNQIISRMLRLPILKALAYYILNPKSLDRKYIFDNIIEHVRMKKYFSAREFNSFMQDMGESVKMGRLNDDYVWAELPVVPRDKQKSAYNFLEQTIDTYPRIGLVEQFF